MTRQNRDNWLPPRPNREDASPRHVGVEIELAGLGAEQMLAAIIDRIGGRAVEHSPVDWRVINTSLGDFKVVLDWSDLRWFAKKHLPPEREDEQLFSRALMGLVTRAAEQLIPWEIVTPPVRICDLEIVSGIVETLRDKGAVGTRQSPQYAFGLHFNPELPDLHAETITRYLKAYLCLYDWIVREERTDMTRKVTYYIRHFDHSYIEKVVDPDYQPDLETLIDDYLQSNPTRNRSLDLLPLFAWLDEPRVRRAVDDPRVSARPTFHYRLPNCDIDNPHWNLDAPWKLWLEVEKLAGDRDRLALYCRDYRRELDRFAHLFDSQWADRVAAMLAGFGD